MPLFQKKPIWLVSLVLGLVLLVGLLVWRYSAYQVIGQTRLYQVSSNQVYEFDNPADRFSYQWQVFWRGNLLAQAQKEEETIYLAESPSLSGLVNGDIQSTYDYSSQGETVETDGLRHYMRPGATYSFNLEKGKTYHLHMRQKIRKTSYRLDQGDGTVSFRVLTGLEDGEYLIMVPDDE